MALAPEDVGQRIEKARKAKGWTHEEFRDQARDRIGAPQLNLRTVQRWQKGRDPATGKSWLPRRGPAHGPGGASRRASLILGGVGSRRRCRRVGSGASPS